ncbi:MAG: hypothetical protein ACKVOQ_23145 [Cyclobacteriaceae bacterium]
MNPHKNLIAIALTILVCPVVAQMMPMSTTFSTPRGNIQTTTWVPGPRMYYGNATANPKFHFTVILKSDSVITLRSRVEAEDKKMYVTQKAKKVKRKIFPSETKEVTGYSDAWGRLKGIPADSCWLFKITPGPINCYSTLPMHDITTTIAIQKGEDGEIVALSKKNLEAITGTEDEKIKKWLEKDKLTKVIQYYNEVNKPTSVAPK